MKPGSYRQYDNLPEPLRSLLPLLFDACDQSRSPNASSMQHYATPCNALRDPGGWGSIEKHQPKQATSQLPTQAAQVSAVRLPAQPVSCSRRSPAFERICGPLAALRSLTIATAMPRSRALPTTRSCTLGATAIFWNSTLGPGVCQAPLTRPRSPSARMRDPLPRCRSPCRR